MCSKGLFKRLLPFFLTFAVGLFIASFFVNISPPRFGSSNRAKRFHEAQQLRFDNEDLREENLRLRNEVNELRLNSSNWDRPVLRALHDPENGNDFPPPPPPRPIRLHRLTVK